jgi:hypothetical protein
MAFRFEWTANERELRCLVVDEETLGKTCPTGLQHSKNGSAGSALQSIISVGAGIVGASTAIYLTQLGAEIHLIDSNAPERATFDLSQHKNSLL